MHIDPSVFVVFIINLLFSIFFFSFSCVKKVKKLDYFLTKKDRIKQGWHFTC